MKQLHLYLLVLTFSLFGPQVFSQWYFETGVNDAKFTNYNDSNPTTLNSYAGFRDFSHAIGYMFPGKKLDERAQPETNAAALRFRIGVGFDQMGLRIKAVKAGSEALHHYDLGQFQAHGGVMFAPTLIRKEQADYYGVRQPAVNLILDAALSYNFYTSATRTLINGTENIKDLKVDNEFEQSYPAYSIGAGFEFPLNKHTALYAKYEIEDSFSNDEDTQIGSEETFSTYKRRVLLGLRVDFRLKNHLKQLQLDRIAALETRDTDALDSLKQDVAELEKAIDAVHKHDGTAAVQENAQNQDFRIVKTESAGALFQVSEHEKGFSYLPAFKHVLFPINSSFFNKNLYASKLSSLALFLKQSPKYRIKLVGYADAKTGSFKYNMQISAERAKRVYDYLINLGVPASRMDHTSFGGTAEFSINELSENRRTEILIIE